jgi:hypothetical protein
MLGDLPSQGIVRREEKLFNFPRQESDSFEFRLFPPFLVACVKQKCDHLPESVNTRSLRRGALWRETKIA